ncbi:MAG: FAD-dependent thymidylate synthase [Anaerolineae bacterium]|nr:FAD-dependent thymidylate synthase [Anaerolineae bacterium]
MQVKLIAVTHYLPDGAGSAHDSEALIEHAGRTCYRSAGGGDAAITARFVQKRVQEGHESIIEHASASFEISGISRACSHQLVRHRLASFSQESQRYVDMSEPDWVIPPDVLADPGAKVIWDEFVAQAIETYRRLRERGVKKEDARFLLPNATATRLIMTANFRELLHVFRLRISPHAQWEIRELCARMLLAILPHAPSVFGALYAQLQESHADLFEALGASKGETA